MKFQDWIFQKGPRARWLAKKITATFPKGSVLLNVGSGDGFLEDQLTTSGFTIISLDPDPSREYGNLIKKTFDEVVFDQQFDGVIFSYSLHHFKDPDTALTKALSLLNPSGKLFILEIAPRTKLARVLFFDSKILCPWRVHSWSAKELADRMQRVGIIQKIIQYGFFSALFIAKPHDEKR